jgi:hypothetical protein
MHTVGVPVIADGKGLTVTVVAILHPLDAAVNVMVAVLAVTPVTVPVIKFTVATDVLLLVHVPNPAASLNVVFEPLHTVIVPKILGGAAFTVTTVVADPPEV